MFLGLLRICRHFEAGYEPVARLLHIRQFLFPSKKFLHAFWVKGTQAIRRELEALVRFESLRFLNLLRGPNDYLAIAARLARFVGDERVLPRILAKARFAGLNRHRVG